jgi:hypothetical protein
MRFFMAGCPTCADDANDILPDLGVHDVWETMSARVAKEDEAVFVKRIRIVRTELVFERSRRLGE